VLWWVATRWGTIHESIVSFAQSAGAQFKPTSRSYGRRLKVIHHDHERRLDAIRSLDLDPDTEEQMLEREMTRFNEELSAHVADRR
jgi:hypothetical protein